MIGIEKDIIPDDWDIKALGEIAVVSSGGSAPQGKKYFTGENPFARVQHIGQDSDSINRYDLISDEAVKKYKLKKYKSGTIVFPKSGASIYLEKRAMLPVDAYIVSHLCAVESTRDDVDQKFLFYSLRQIPLSKDKADGYPTLNLSEIKRAVIPMPSFEEQRKIASILSKIQQAITQQEQVIAKTKELKRSLMQRLFTHGLRDEELKETEIGLIPKSWEVVKLEEIANVSSGGSAPQGEKYFNGENPFIRVQHVEEDADRITRWDLITGKAVKKYKLKLYPKGTIVFPKSGASVYLEKRAMLPVNAYIVSHLCAVNASSQKVNQKFLFYELRNIKLSEKKADSYPTLNLSEVKNVKVLLPPLSEQQEIANILSSVDNKIQQAESRKQSLQSLFKTMLNNLMTGKVRVKDIDFSDVIANPEGAKQSYKGIASSLRSSQ